MLLNQTVTIVLSDLLFSYSRKPETRRSVMKILTNEKSQILIRLKGFIKSTVHRPTDHPTTDHLPTDPPTTDQLTQ